MLLESNLQNRLEVIRGGRLAMISVRCTRRHRSKPPTPKTRTKVDGSGMGAYRILSTEGGDIPDGTKRNVSATRLNAVVESIPAKPPETLELGFPGASGFPVNETPPRSVFPLKADTDVKLGNGKTPPALARRQSHSQIDSQETAA